MKLTNVCLNTLFAACLVTACKSSPGEEVNGIEGFSRSQEAHFPLNDKPTTLDPRLSQNTSSSNISQLLFEGLTYIDDHGKILPGVAQSIQISPDLKTYTFTLRDAVWSDGDKIKASDFEYSWLSALNPEFKAPYAYMLFAIQGAQSYFEGKCSQEDVGIHALDDKTLAVTLENPSPYFLQLTSTAAYLPVSQKWTEAHPDFKESSAMKCVSNGPFKVFSFVPGQKLEMVKNERYWAANTVMLAKTRFSFMEDQAAVGAFQKGDLDWVGSPLSTLGAPGQEMLKQANMLNFSPAAGTQFLRLNVAKAPFSSHKFRKAFMLATDTQGVVTNIMKGDQKPTGALVPPGLGLQEKAPSYDVTEAARLFEEALLEMGMTRNDLPSITMTYVASDRMQKIAEFLAQGWKNTFNIDIEVAPQDSQGFYDKLFAHDFQIAAGSWFADYYDPMSFLSVFQTKDNGMNYTGWENADYTRLLNESNLEIDPTARMHLLQQAQDVLVQDLPILPLFTFSFAHGANPRLQKAVLTPMGMVDIDGAYFIDIKEPKSPVKN